MAVAGPGLIEFGQCQAGVGRLWLDSGQIRPAPAQICPMLANFGRFRGNLVGRGRDVLVEVVRHRASSRLRSVQLWSMSGQIGRGWSKLPIRQDPRLAIRPGFGPLSVTFDPDSARFGRFPVGVDRLARFRLHRPALVRGLSAQRGGTFSWGTSGGASLGQ